MMASSCISSTCVNDKRLLFPPRMRYVHIHEWLETDRGAAMRGGERVGHLHPRVVDSISCRQMYLRSYTFTLSKKESEAQKAKKCFGRVKKVKVINRKLGKAKVNCGTLLGMFRRLLSCTTKVDVAS